MNAENTTRVRLVETAARLFHEQGYEATGVATILREAGVHSGSLYHFFSSKEDLLAAVLDRYLEKLRPEILDRAESAADDPIDRVFALLDLYRAGLQITHCGLGCPIGNLALELGESKPELREKIEANFRNWSRGVCGWLEKAAPRLPENLDLGEFSLFILVVMEGAMMQARAFHSVEPFDAALRQLRRYFDSLLAERSTSNRIVSGTTRRRKG
jgi:TetR/AcrR family transcriptional regulator, transcriptional repressor for nem operon